MTATSPESTQPSTDTINVLPTLSEAKAPVSLTLTIDKSVSKVATWLLAVVIGCGVLIGAGVVVGVWVLVAMRDEAREHRLVDDDWQKMNAYLQTQGVTKDENGFYTLGKPKEQKDGRP